MQNLCESLAFALVTAIWYSSYKSTLYRRINFFNLFILDFEAIEPMYMNIVVL